ncbi:MAG: hypothetical protein SFT68_01285 [Rickettsiaceae bacterium]|nr:hypothetical protein [Rickettsiaceae bacterium]
MHKEAIHPYIKKLSIKLKQNNFMSRIIEDLSLIYSPRITFGCEVELYLSQETSDQELIEYLPQYSFIKERGKNQIEYHIGPSSDPDLIIHEFKASIDSIQTTLSSKGIIADFSPKPYLNDYGNALQIQFTSNSALFQDSVDKICSSFCEYARSTFLAYAPNISDYQRFHNDIMSPSYICYGYNNRSCLVRVCNHPYKRIEIRVPSPICDLYVVFCTILQQIKLASFDLAPKYKPIYGIASDAQYNLEKIPTSIEEAAILFDKSFFAK